MRIVFSKPAGLPERVIQFGAGILLRGLPDYFIDKANKQGIFNGRILVVKSTQVGISDFASQNTTFTTFVRGIIHKKKIEEEFINIAISRIRSANDHWPEIVNEAQNPNLQIIISNTTEVGILFRAESIFQSPPISFPAKLTAFLYERFKKLGMRSPITVVIPTELIPRNGNTLKEIVHHLADFNALEAGFYEWLSEKILFCNSLVDRIVTRPSPSPLTASDPMAIQTEPYRLWAIQGNERVRNILSFAEADEGVIVAENIDDYSERKLRLLNGTHSIGACMGFLKGFDTVHQCMENEEMSTFLEKVMLTEILPTISSGTAASNTEFGRSVLDRFRNPFIEHRLLDITVQSTAKMKMRNIPTLFRYLEKFGKVPDLMAKGFAAYLLFMKSEKKDGQFYGRRKAEHYLIRDQQAEYFHELWQARELKGAVSEICKNADLWDADLTQIPNFAEAAYQHLSHFMDEG